MRWATLVLLLLTSVGCNDLRAFRSEWQGARVGNGLVHMGGGEGAATLTIDTIDDHGLAGQLTVAGLLSDVPIRSLEGAESDALASMSFSGGPLRVYLAFAAMPDNAGDAFAVIALYDDHRVELRLLRAGVAPLYAIYALSETKERG